MGLYQSKIAPGMIPIRLNGSFPDNPNRVYKKMLMKSGKEGSFHTQMQASESEHWLEEVEEGAVREFKELPSPA